MYVLPPLRLSWIFTVARRQQVGRPGDRLRGSDRPARAGRRRRHGQRRVADRERAARRHRGHAAVRRDADDRRRWSPAPVAVQARLPLAGADDASVVQVAPPSRLSSTRTVVPAGRLLVQEIVRAVPIAQLAPAVGDVTASVGVTIWKAAPTPLAGTAPIDVTRTRASAASGPVAVQTKLPVLGAAAASDLEASRRRRGSARSTPDRRRAGCASR